VLKTATGKKKTKGEKVARPIEQRAKEQRHDHATQKKKNKIKATSPWKSNRGWNKNKSERKEKRAETLY
jgi:uncharacterized membrane protein YdbT with pleckstrin-like domain